MQTGETRQSVKVWDAPVRLFHWSLVILFVLSAYSAFQDKFGSYADMHFYSGYTILILVTWRVFWGFWGSETARFSTFLKSPVAAFTHLIAMIKGEPYREAGHSPLAALSVVLMLALLLAQAIMGLYASDGMIFSGPLSDDVSGRISSDMTTWHKLLGRILIGLVSLHVVAILLYALLKRVNLVGPMITGRAKHVPSAIGPALRSPWLALGLFFVAGGIVCSAVFLL